MTSEVFDVTETAPTGSGTELRPSEAPASGLDSAKERAAELADQGAQGGTHVASIATDQAKEVASEVGHQAKALWSEARTELLEQASSQQKRVADQLHELSRELGSMASKSEQDGLATGLAQQASRQVGSAAHWLAEREPGSLVSELKGFASSRPGAFLAVAAGIGLVAGRLTRGVAAGPPAQDSAVGALSANDELEMLPASRNGSTP